MKNVLIALGLMLVQLPGHSQLLTQTLKGRVIDNQSKAPLAGATVVVLNSSPLIGTTTDEHGVYRLTNVPLGRQQIRFTYMGYGEQIIPNVLLTSGKEMVLDIEAGEDISTLKEVTVKGTDNPTNAALSYAASSSRLFNAEETRRFAGSRNDPSRMAANYAGVVSANDARNDIIIRGNSPAGLLWRLEGVDIPNPNHFGSLTGTGGPVSQINNNVLDRSLFLTGAFPAMYGNATSGVFDLRFRNGNAEKREYVGQIGFNGFELGTEGPIKKGGRSSYLINYRYSAPALLQGLGINFGTGGAIPYYQDLSLKLNIPTKKAGQFTVFGLAGSSHITFKGSLADTTNFYTDPYTNVTTQNRSGVLGATHTYFWNRSTFTKLVIAYSGIQTGILQDSLNQARQAFPQFRDHSWQGKLTAHLTFNRKINTRNTLILGLITNQVTAHLVDSVLVTNRFRTIRNFSGQTLFYQAYAQYQHRFDERLTLNTGFYTQLLALNSHYSFEPRLNMRYALNPTTNLTFGLGRHSQMQPLGLYLNQAGNPAENQQTNRNLDFTYSDQVVVGYEHQLPANWRVKLESYYQAISNVPVERIASSYSLLNSGTGYVVTDRTNLVNSGTGRNYGVELTLERTYTNGYYFLGTASLFNSQYRGSDGILRATAYAVNHVANLLAGKELRLGTRNVLAIDVRTSWVGGKPYTPIDIVASSQQHTEVDNPALAFSQHTNPYFRTDVKLTYRRNSVRAMQEWFIDFQNITNARNLYGFQYDNQRNRLVSVYQIGFYPNLNWRIHF
ncbi:TonB-dependent receptor [Spirosoma pollinicola]|uniref:TonB-dependent receptor n=1 Tax=Spirosoma pollinicola TaxID=2057025 RepID=A0A2K8Z3F4_9BACT|nr:TonB-dependent receptor [Spirosoma pollinicola]AUD04416.1 TonB-dependent receptor [Spirosoma pollinicola]